MPRRVLPGRLVKAAAAAAGTALVLAGCAVTPLKMGAAAIVGSQRISIASLNTEVANLSQEAAKYPAVVDLTATEKIQDTLSWLVKFKVADELARQHGITVTKAQAQAALASAYANAKSAAASEGLTHVSLDEILAASGIAPNLAGELGRYEAIENAYLASQDGGKLPTSTSAQNALSGKLAGATCTAAKALDIEVNPQFGELDYSQIQVVAAPSKVARSPGPAATPSPVATTPAC